MLPGELHLLPDMPQIVLGILHVLSAMLEAFSGRNKKPMRSWNDNGMVALIRKQIQSSGSFGGDVASVAQT